MIKRINDLDIGALEQERDDLRQELLGVQEMLAFVLASIGEPVVIPKNVLQAGLPENVQISIDDNQKEDAFIFSLVEFVDENE